MSELIKYSLEFPIQSSITILYNRLSSPEGLAEWFADNVTVKDTIYIFYWNGIEQSAKLENKEMNKFIRYKWTDDHSSVGYFEFLIRIDSITQDVALIVTDFAKDEYEKEEQTNLWTKQIDQLKRAIGS